MTKKKYRIGVVGGGSFGTAIAHIASLNNYEVAIWMRDPLQAEYLNKNHINKRYLPDFLLHPNVSASTDLQQVTESANMIFIAIPSGFFREVVRQLPKVAGKDLISTTKGIEEGTFLVMSDILKQEHPAARVGVLSGPNLAREIMQRTLTATVIASLDEELCLRVREVLHSEFFRIYVNQDSYGIELAGALKNIYAISVGVAAALGLGENTKSMLITRGLAEMSRFAVKLGANPLTFLGLGGVGDLVVTCASALSRNYRIGYLLGKGKSLDEANQQVGQTVEGISTLNLVYHKALALEVSMPIMTWLYSVVYLGHSPTDLSQHMRLTEERHDVEFSVGREKKRGVPC